MLIARILSVSLVTSGLVTGLGIFLLRTFAEPPQAGTSYTLPAFLLACVGGVIGAVAGAAQEVVQAQQSKAPRPLDLE